MNELKHHGILGMKWGVRRYQNADGTHTEAGKRRYHDDYTRAHDRKPVSQMSDEELKQRVNRLNQEQQYSDLKWKRNAGVNAANKFVKTAALITAVAGAAVVYKKYGDSVLSAIGNIPVSSLA